MNNRDYRALQVCALLLFLLLITMLAASGCTSQFDGDTYAYSKGGKVKNFALKLEEYQRTGLPVRLSGFCNSSCTLFLALPSDQVCHTHGTTYMFHRSWGGTYAERQLTDHYMWNTYPRWVQIWLYHEGWDAYDRVMPYSYASQYVRMCE